MFDIEKIPCSHAITTAKDVNIHVSTLVCQSYSKEYLYAAYAANIYPKSEDTSHTYEDLGALKSEDTSRNLISINSKPNLTT